MFERRDLEVLAAYKGGHPVVSLYLHLDPHLRGTPDAYRARLKGLLKEATGRAPAEDISAIEAYFEKEFDWSGRSVAVFSSQGGGLWQVERFAVPLPTYIHVGQKPFIMPLADLMDTYGSYSVALVDQQSARMLHFHLGEVVASEKVEGEEVKRLKGGGGQGAARARGDESSHGRETVRSNLKDFAEAVESFCTRHKAEHLLLGGADTTVAQFRGMLSQPWQDRVEGTFSISVQAPEKEVLARSLETLQARHDAHEQELIETIQTLAAKNANGTVGIEGTLEAIYAGRVQTLALLEGLSVPGFRCEGCGYVTSHRVERCPYCNAQVAPIPNVAEHAVRQVVEQGGQIEFLKPNSRLAELGGMAGLLRY
jgi:peptide chain release factor subunit 1